METIDFPAAGPDHPQISSPEVEQAIQGMARSLTVTVGCDAPHRFESIYLERVGYARIPQLIVPVWAKDEHRSSLVPVARQRAFGWLAERGVDGVHLRTVPGISSGARKRKFCDQ